MENKFWSFAGIALAVMAFFYKDVSTFHLILLGIATVAICYFLSYIWNKFLNSHHKWVDCIFYFFTKTRQPYIVTDKIAKYTIKNACEAEYDVKCNLIVKKPLQNFCYKGRYHWDQDEDIDVSVNCSCSHRFETSEDLKWSNVDIFPTEEILHRNQPLNCGFSLKKLHITHLNKHSYLSCKMIEKVKHLKLIATVDPALKPTNNAIFIVQDSLGEEISREEVHYHTSTNSYEKTIAYPRRGRKYVIKWDYSK